MLAEGKQALECPCRYSRAHAVGDRGAAGAFIFKRVDVAPLGKKLDWSTSADIDELMAFSVAG